MSVSIGYIVPVHNDEHHLEIRVMDLVNHLKKQRFSSFIVLVENGSQDLSRHKVWELSKKNFSIPIYPLSLETKGLGFALAAGITQALAIKKDKNLANLFLLLTASDLPFGFSDLEQFLARLETSEVCQIAIGSKAHPQSQITNSILRKVMSFFYRGLRRLILGMKTRDSQGTIFIPSSLAEVLNSLTQSRDFFYSTELIYWAEKRGCSIVELPVILDRIHRSSSVRVFRDSFRMFKQMISLRDRGRVLSRASQNR